jgi:DNA modification methylase
MGWGGRLVGACALDIPNYIGVDSNYNLREPYTEMTKFLNNNSKTNIKLFFQDALSIDYSKLNYDLVLTSPPYYNTEMYGSEKNKGTNFKNKEEWNNDFYIPIIEKTFKNLKKGGHYCLNIHKDLYKNVVIKILGKSYTKIALPKSKRTNEETYQEFIYIWEK